MGHVVLLCHRHPWCLHEGGWQVVRAGDQRVLAIHPSHLSRTRTRAPDGL
jgi:hypothetical protein